MLAKLRLPTRPQISRWLVYVLFAGLFVALTPVPAHAAVPSAPRSVAGFAGNGFVKITFKAPSPNANITNYKFSIDSGTTYTTISPGLGSSASDIWGSNYTTNVSYNGALIDQTNSLYIFPSKLGSNHFYFLNNCNMQISLTYL